MPGSKLLHRIHEISERAGFTDVAVSLYDYEAELSFSYRADQFFHAASTIKVAILLALFRAVDTGRVKLDSSLHVRNHFRSVADGEVFRLARDRDADASVYKHLGRARPLSELARAMIVRSSNLATNLIFDFLGLDYIRAVLDEAGIHGVKVERCVEDERAFEGGRNNEVTADGLSQIFRLLCDKRFLSENSVERMTEILLAQEFNSMIPARLPDGTKVAHKTGEISTVCHDAGIVFLPERKPYCVAVLTQGQPGLSGRNKAVASISAAIYHYLMPERAKRDE